MSVLKKIAALYIKAEDSEGECAEVEYIWGVNVKEENVQRGVLPASSVTWNLGMRSATPLNIRLAAYPPFIRSLMSDQGIAF